HPEYYSYTAGMLVATSYPLYNANQLWTDHAALDKRLQFANARVQGTYNATLALLNYDVSGAPLSESSPRLIEYGMPGIRCFIRCAPPVWITVVGRDTPWPIKAIPAESLVPVEARSLA